ncbi:MAG: HAMP domain-containing histidine kinase [Clostridiales bacterium]|nr:HAMP domain-containing histidine kinase [Clostridiales bacterium]
MKHIFDKRSIKTVFIIYTLVCLLAALLLSLILSNICQMMQAQIYQTYQVRYEMDNPDRIIGFDSSDVSEQKGVVIYQQPMSLFEHFTSFDRTVYEIFGVLSVGVYPICFLICLVITSFLFYKQQMQKPFVILDKAAARIAERDLDFHIAYQKENELGRLCTSFEKMRQALQENNKEMWRQIEERKRLNAAFSHDLRTPLTVLKGQSELLAQYADKMTAEKVIHTADLMHRHITRLEAYVETMGDLQRLEDIEIRRVSMPFAELCTQLKEVGMTICGDKQLICELPVEQTKRVCVDFAVVLRVYENLLANAVRFSESKIITQVKVQDEFLYLSVCDDGKGFAEKDLKNLLKPFYKTSEKDDDKHFGMGLHICKILCEKHGGSIQLCNQTGACVTAIFRQ